VDAVFDEFGFGYGDAFSDEDDVGHPFGFVAVHLQSNVYEWDRKIQYSGVGGVDLVVVSGCGSN
jgi:hypothetical protein